MYSGITSDRVFDGELLYEKILEVDLFAFAYKLFHEDFSSINAPLIEENLHEQSVAVGKCEQINF